MSDLKDLQRQAGARVFRDFFPDFKDDGKNVRCRFHDDRKPSFNISETDGVFRGKCFGCNWSGDSIDLLKEIEGLSFAEAVDRLKEVTGNGNGKGTADRKSQTLTLDGIKSLRIGKDGKPSESGEFSFLRSHLYNNGRPPYLKVLYADGKGNKTAKFFSVTGADQYAWRRRSEAVLYHGDLLTARPADPVLYSESEKDCDCLSALGFLAVSAGGASCFNERHAEALRGRTVTILPHCDEAGLKCRDETSKLLRGVAKSVRSVDLVKAWDDCFPGSAVPTGADVADLLSLYQDLYGEEKDPREAVQDLLTRYTESLTPCLMDSLLRWNDVINLDVRIDYLLDRIIPKGAITLLFGRGGIGKTSLLLQMSRAIAEGLPFADRETEQTTVVYVDNENPLSVLQDRAQRIGKATNLYVWHVSSSDPPPKLDADNWHKYKELPAGLIVVDTLRASHAGDENDSRVMSQIISRLKELRELGFTVLLLHHTPKHSDAIFKGSGAILDCADHVLSLEEVRDDEGQEFATDRTFRLATRIKTRFEPSELYLTFDPELKGFSVTDAPDLTTLQDVQAILREAGRPLSQRELKAKVRTETDLTERESRRILKRGTGTYWKTRRGGPTKRSFMYELID